ncbi:sugar phosphate isomerase/epimerase family protein [Rubellimicrobium arenae]|uniref:sugar phosphate isomerase/epimerase family protein n=1 Tax=Rubellimicrobium arenae TaxID=2817372 RepID=UPI001B30DC6A
MTPAVSTAAFDGHPWEVAFDSLAALGVEHVEPAFIKGYVAFTEEDFQPAAAARMARLLSDRGLRPQGVSAHMDLSAPDAGRMLDRRIGFAAELGASHLITNAGPAAGREAILRRLEAALPALDDAGLILALENPGHGSGDLIGRGEEGAALAARLDHPRLRLNLDVGNLLTYAGGLEPGLSAALPHAAHAHLKDVAADGPDWRFVPLGTGLVDWPEVARTIARLAPDLPLAIELPLRLWRPGRGDPVRQPEPRPVPVIEEALRRSLETWAAA